MDRIEKFIKDNRHDLDKYDPSPDIWDRIRKKVGFKKGSAVKWLSIAAMILFVLGTAVTIFIVTNRRIDLLGPGFAEQEELKETEIFYNSMINTLYLEARPMLTGQPEIQKELDTDLAQIDSLCADIKKDLKDNVSNEQVIEALIQNYRIKIQILEDMLEVLKKNNGQVNKTQEGHEM